MVANDQAASVWKRERPVVTPAGGWEPIPGSRRRSDAELPAEWRPWLLLMPRLHFVRSLVSQALKKMNTGRPAGH
jgi:hypothetical protein